MAGNTTSSVPRTATKRGSRGRAQMSRLPTPSESSSAYWRGSGGRLARGSRGLTCLKYRGCPPPPRAPRPAG
eukprot:1182061-Prorocentrum_minimum.AAC.1